MTFPPAATAFGAYRGRRILEQQCEALFFWMVFIGGPGDLDVPHGRFRGEELYLRFVHSYSGRMDEIQEWVCSFAMFKNILSAKWPVISWE
jgi:hypothetical protein